MRAAGTAQVRRRTARPADRSGARSRPVARPKAPARPSRRWRSTVALFAGLLLAGALFHVWSRLHVVDLGYRLAAARAAHAQLVEQNRRLSLELATLEAPARVAEAARRQLGLVPPSPSQIVHVGAVVRPEPGRSGTEAAR